MFHQWVWLPASAILLTITRADIVRITRYGLETSRNRRDGA